MAAHLPTLGSASSDSVAITDDHVVMRDVHKSFGDTAVLNGIDLRIPAGQFVALVGKSGCGKSTLLRLLAGLDYPTQGQVLVNGTRLAKQNAEARVMFQDARLLPWKRVRDNVGLGWRGDWVGEANRALSEVGLTQKADEWPAVLSGGQRQRVALARALVSKPRLLLLDEPLGALDALTRLDMQRLVERLWLQRRFTVLLITHDVAEAALLADRILVIEHGRITLDEIIDIPRPRPRNIVEINELQERILDRILGEPEV